MCLLYFSPSCTLSFRTFDRTFVGHVSLVRTCVRRVSLSPSSLIAVPLCVSLLASFPKYGVVFGFGKHVHSDALNQFHYTPFMTAFIKFNYLVLPKVKN